MPRASNLVSAGLLPLQTAAQIVGQVQSGVSAAGSTYANAAPIYGDVVVVTSCSPAQGVILSGPPFSPGDTVFVANDNTGVPVLVYPPAGARINALAATSGGFSIGNNKCATFVVASPTHIYAQLSA